METENDPAFYSDFTRPGGRADDAERSMQQDHPEDDDAPGKQILLDRILGEDDHFDDDMEAQGQDQDYPPGSESPTGHAPGYPMRFWRVDTPLRIEPPPSFNAPPRPPAQTQEQQIKASRQHSRTFITPRLELDTRTSRYNT